MGAIFNVIFYVLVFLGLYAQVFYLVTFLENRKTLTKKHIVRKEYETYPSVSILVPCYNEEKTIAKTINSLLSIDYPAGMAKIIVINDGSTDATWEAVQQFAANEQIVLLNKENGGKTSALNYGLKQVATELVASVDADTYLPKTALKDIAHYFITNPETMAVGGATVISNPKTFVQHAQSAEYNLFIFTKKILAMFGGALVVPGAFSVYRKRVFDTIGEYRDGNSLEDLELTYRMQVSGYRIEQAHDVFAETTAPASVRSLFKQRLRWAYGFINNTLDYKHVIFNKKYGNFGLFTVPTALIAYVVILYVFFVGWYRVISGFVEKFSEIKAVGISNAVGSLFTFDIYKINTSAAVLFSGLLFISVIVYMFIGRYLAKDHKSSYRGVVYFFVLYNLIVPFWIMAAVYNTAMSKKVAWR